MARLPEIQPRGALTRNPQSSVTPADIANPYQQIASAFDAAGQVVRAKALDDARIEGQNAVARDANGNLIVSERSNWTEAGRTYNRYAQQNYLARAEIDTKNTMQRLQREANGDPDKFAASAKAFSDQMLKNTDRDYRGPIETMLQNEIGLAHTGVQQQKYRYDMATTKSTLLESLEMKDNDRAALARQGGVDTAEYKKAYAETRTLWNELTANPVFEISPEQAEIRLKAASSRDAGEAILGEADKLIVNGGPEAARKLSDRILTDTSLSMSPTDRRKYSGLVDEAIRSYRAEQKAAVEPFKDIAKDRVKSWEAGTGLDDSDNEELIAGIAKGDPAFAHYLTGRLETMRKVRDIRNMGDQQQVQLLEQTRAGGGSVVDKIVGAESSGSATAKNPNSSAEGAGQFIDSTWLSMIRKYRPDIAAGKSAQDLLALKTNADLSKEMTARYAQENTEFLKNQAIPITDGNVYLAHFLGPRGAAQVIKADPSTPIGAIVGDAVMSANPFLNGMSAADVRQWASKKMGGGSSPITGEAAKALQTEVTSDLRRGLSDWETRMKRGDIPDASSLDLLSRQLSLVDDQDLRDQYSSIARQSEAFQNAYQANPAAAESFLSSLQARSAGAGASIAELQIQDSYQAGMEAAAAAKKADPLGYAARVYTGFPEMPPLDVNNPGSYAGTLRQYQTGVNIAEARGEMVDIPAFRPAQADAIARMWQTANPAQLNALTDAMGSTLTPRTLKATLTDNPIKEALTGAILSNDPAKHSAAMQQLDLLSGRVSMPELEASFGPDVVDRLQDWQARVRYMSPVEVQDWLKQRNDPQWQERVKPLVEKGKTEARKVTFEDVVSQLDTNRIFNAGAPVDDQTRRMMMNDYVSLVGERNASLGDIDKAKTQAVERMQKRWGVTSVYGGTGGRVMLYPPESFYPDIGGKDWIGKELQGIAAAHGVDVNSMSLVSDKKTQDAVSRGEAPGYLMTIVDPATGSEELVTDDQGRPLRHFFDPQAAQADAQKAAQEARRTRNDPWFVAPGGIAVGPLYPGGADPADLQMRQDRIKEITTEQNTDRAKRKAKHDQVRQQLRENGLPGEK